MKRILAIFIAMLLVAVAVPFVASAATAQMWYLNDTTTTVGREMDKGTTDSGETSVSIDNGNSVVWIADEAALTDVGFPAGTWGGLIYLTSEVSGTIVLDVGHSDNTADNFTSNGATQSIDPEGGTFFSVSIIANGFDISSGDFLAFKMTNNTGSTIAVDTGGSSQSYIVSPPSDPGYPIPELPTIVLLATGLVGLAGYFGLKRRKRAYVRA